jgi:hypothetical protein
MHVPWYVNDAKHFENLGRSCRRQLQVQHYTSLCSGVVMLIWQTSEPSGHICFNLCPVAACTQGLDASSDVRSPPLWCCGRCWPAQEGCRDFTTGISVSVCWCDNRIACHAPVVISLRGLSGCHCPHVPVEWGAQQAAAGGLSLEF